MKEKNLFYFCRGEMAERSIAAVLKTVDCNRSGGSNPSFSALEKKRPALAGFFFGENFIVGFFLFHYFTISLFTGPDTGTEKPGPVIGSVNNVVFSSSI